MRIMRSLSLTPRFSGVISKRGRFKTVLTVFFVVEWGSRRSGDWKTVKTVRSARERAITPLKRGVNETSPVPIQRHALSNIAKI